jgi:hypothetical protein
MLMDHELQDTPPEKVERPRSKAPRSPDMKSHRGAGTQDQDARIRRSNEAGDEDIEEPSVPTTSDPDLEDPTNEDTNRRRTSP